MIQFDSRENYAVYTEFGFCQSQVAAYLWRKPNKLLGTNDDAVGMSSDLDQAKVSLSGGWLLHSTECTQKKKK